MGDAHKSKADMIKSLFKGIWTLEYIDTDKEVQEVVEKAIQDPNGFVIKPQKEGGGNNFYGDSVKDMLIKAKENKEALEDIR